MMHIGDEITIPVYLFRNGGGIANMSEIVLVKTSEWFQGDLSFSDFPAYMIENNKVTIPFHLVYGPNGESVEIGETPFIRKDDIFVGLVTIDLVHQQEMCTARSLIY